MQITQKIFISTSYFGQSPREMERIHESLQIPYSYSFFCPICGTVWATSLVEASGKISRFVAITRTCENHSQIAEMQSLEQPGSLWLSWDKHFTSALTVEVLRREFLLLTKKQANACLALK